MNFVALVEALKQNRIFRMMYHNHYNLLLCENITKHVCDAAM